MGRIMAVCVSEKRGTQKKNIQEAELIEDFGLQEMRMQENGTDR